MKQRRNYYQILYVQPDAPQEIIRTSYHTLMRELKKHPDLGGDNGRAAVINEAYETLCDGVNRAKYDDKLRKYFEGGNTFKPENAEKESNRNYYRAFTRIKKNGKLLYSLPWLQPKREAEMINFSPGGIRFMCSEALTQRSVIKLSGPFFTAEALIINSQQNSLTGKFYTVGAEFLTVTFKNTKGSFLSVSA